ncbi:MAG: hypothetical protein LBR34_08690 [Prevotella sp.]|jgi:hypothetical protein|nr:hypothetical protein [Prevotella sp.]
MNKKALTFNYNGLANAIEMNCGVSPTYNPDNQPSAKFRALWDTGAFDESQAMAVGKEAGAKYICVSNVNSDDGFDFAIAYSLKDVETGGMVAHKRKTLAAGELKSAFAQISKSQLLASNNVVGNTSQKPTAETSNPQKSNFEEEDENDVSAATVSETSFCGCEIAEADLPEGADIPKGWRLPTLAELECMCQHKDEIGGFNFGVYLSSNKEQGYLKGIKFQFCNDVTVTGNYSIRVVRGGNSKLQSGTVRPQKRQILPLFLP